jgi:DNA polymerase (family 10)
VRIAVSTDAHSKNELALMRFGIAQARRGWLEPRDVVNTLTWPELKEVLKRR